MDTIKKITRNDAMIEAYKDLIKTTEEKLNINIARYNLQMIIEAKMDITDDVKTRGVILELENYKLENKEVIENTINALERRLKALEASKAKYESI